jgi:hypothetical protein
MDESMIKFDNKMPDTAMSSAEIEALLAKPTISPDELFRSRIFPLSRNGIYKAIERREIEVAEFGRKKAVITAPIRKKLGL